MIKDVEKLSPAELEDLGGEKIRDALNVLSEHGYQIYHNGHRLVRNTGGWSWIK